MNHGSKSPVNSEESFLKGVTFNTNLGKSKKCYIVSFVTFVKNVCSVESRFKKARFKKESRFKKDCCYNQFFSTYVV